MPRQFILYHHISAPVERVYPYFADVERFAAKHPIMYKIEKEAENRYRIYERLRLLWLFPYQFYYPMWVEEAVPNKKVVLAGTPQKGLELHICIEFDTTGIGKTTVKETVTVTGGWLSYKVLRYFLTKSHKTLVSRIAEELNNV